MFRSISVTALASFIALSTQSAFAQTTAPDAAPIAAPTAAVAIAHAGPAEQRSASAISVSLADPARVRHAARIPGTFAINSTDTSREGDALVEQLGLRALLPALAGDGGS